jgi:hypothetical protein
LTICKPLDYTFFSARKHPPEKPCWEARTYKEKPTRNRKEKMKKLEKLVLMLITFPVWLPVFLYLIFVFTFLNFEIDTVEAGEREEQK